MKPAPLPAARSEWAQHPERSNMFWLRVMTWISLRLGRRPARLVLVFIALYFLLFAAAARRASQAYLRRALGRPPGAGDLYRHFLSFASTIHDRVYLINERFDLFDIAIEGKELIDAVIARGAGVFLLGGHLGSFEVLRAVGRSQPGPRVAMAMYEENARQLNAMLAAINPRAAQDILPLGRIDSMLTIRDKLDAGQVVGILGDRSLHDEARQPVSLLGDTAWLPVGPLRMAAMLGRPVIFMSGLYLGGNRYRLRFQQLADFTDLPRSARSAAITQALADYAAMLEAACHRAPYNWFNFFDFWAPPAPAAKASTP